MTTQVMDGFAALEPPQRTMAIRQAIDAAAEPTTAAKEMAEAAITSLPLKERQAYVQALLPQESKHRLLVYVAGFTAATLVVFGTVIALTAKNSTYGAQLILLATAFASGIIGGLFGNMKAS